MMRFVDPACLLWRLTACAHRPAAGLLVALTLRSGIAMHVHII